MIEFISLAIILLILFIALFWLRKVLFIFGFFFKAFLLFMLVCVVGSIVFGYYVIKDANDFRTNFQDSTSMILLKSTNSSEVTFLAGSIVNPKQTEFEALTKEQLIGIEKNYTTDKFTSLNKEYYKIFVVELNALNNMTIEGITDKGIELSKEQIREIMLSINAKDKVAQIVAKQTGESKDRLLKEITLTNEEIKSYLLSYYMSDVFNPKDTAKIILELKNGNIKIYKETALFKAIKLLPQSLFKSLVSE